ncbi:MAG: copper chaperone PCu(A)C [Methylobacterium mesophilicum]|nr:copper chaperone PCu(A)C [Methylobacterium mesophilicum]
MNRTLLAAALALSASPAFAHASLESAEAPAGGYKAVFRIGHGCEGQSTQTLAIDLPEGFVGAKPGWDQIPAEEQKPYALKRPAPTVTLLAADDTGGGGHEMGAMGAGMTMPGAMGTEATEAGGAAAGEAKAARETKPGEMKAGDLALTGAWARTMLPSQKTGGAYMTISNAGGEADRLVSASSPASDKVEVHSMTTENDVMVMRPVQGGLEIPAGGKVELAPGGLHLMFTNVKTLFKTGETVPLTLNFEKAGSVRVDLPVQRSANR